MPSGNRSLRPGNQRRLPSPGRRPGPAFAYAAVCVVVAMSASVQLAAAEHRIAPGTPLQPAIEAAEPGDTGTRARYWSTGRCPWSAKRAR